MTSLDDTVMLCDAVSIKTRPPQKPGRNVVLVDCVCKQSRTLQSREMLSFLSNIAAHNWCDFMMRSTMRFKVGVCASVVAL